MEDSRLLLQLMFAQRPPGPEHPEHGLWINFYNEVPYVLQKGHSCGIAALCMADRLIKNARKSTSYIQLDDAIAFAQLREYSNHGEMFSASNMKTMAEDLLECHVELLSNSFEERSKIVHHLAKGHPILVPYDANVTDHAKPFNGWGRRAHWAVLIEFSGDHMLKLWKGLFYCMWMSDKPEVQEELARTISELIHVFGSTDPSLQFIKGFFETMNREWSNLDYLRIDKYMMFVRVFLNQSLEFVRKLKWHEETTNQLIGILENAVINPKAEDASMGLRIHMADIYVEELAKVAGNELTGPQLTLFFLPYCRLLAENKNAALRWSVIHHVFEFTMRLCEDNEGDESGDESEDQFEEPTSPSKEREVVPDGGKHEEEDEDMESDEDEHLHKLYGEYKGEDKFLRKVRRHELESMKIPFPNFDYQHIGDTLLELVGTSVVPIKQKLRNQAYNLVKRFHEMACGVFPLDCVNPSIGRRLRGRDYDAAALRLLQLDEEISKEKRSWRESDDRKRKQMDDSRLLHRLFAKRTPGHGLWISFYNNVQSVLQKGPSCGIAALCTADRLIKKSASHIKFDDAIAFAKLRGYSNHGEMFSGVVFQTNATEALPGRIFKQDLTLPWLYHGSADHNVTIVDPGTSKTEVYVYAKQGRDNNTNLWNLDTLASSNANLEEVNPKIMTGLLKYRIPEDGSCSGLKNKVLLLT